jgi:hypothetical protein
MILKNLFLPHTANRQSTTSGMDSLDKCFNKQHFLNYPHAVEYQYNSRGFRDTEWPDSLEELQDAIWCIGDSFTVGIGSPYEFTWSQVLTKATGRRCINVSMDGASNTWIKRRACQIIEEIKPSNMVLLWSYFHRRENSDTSLPDEKRRMHLDLADCSDYDNLKNFIDCYSSTKQCASTTTNVVHGIIPNAVPGHSMDQCWKDIKSPAWPDKFPTTQLEFEQLPDHIKKETKEAFTNEEMITWFTQNDFWKHNQLIELCNLDYARDYHHFDRITSEFFVEQILKNFDS